MYFVVAKNTTASELFKSLNEYFTGKLNWSSCVGVSTDGAAAMIGSLSGLTVWIKEVAPECQATHCVNGKCWRAEKYHRENAGEPKNIT